MIIRECISCGKTATLLQGLDEFVINHSCKFSMQNICKDCKKIQARKERKSNPLKSRESSKKYRDSNIEKLNSYVKEWKCSKCDFTHPTRFPFDFHHTIPENKEETIGNIMHHSWDKIKKEVDKCIILCANCHRLEHSKEDY